MLLFYISKCLCFSYPSVAFNNCVPYCVLSWTRLFLLFVGAAARVKGDRFDVVSSKTYLYNFEPFKPYLYKVNWDLQECALFFLFMLKNIDCGYSLELPRRCGSNEYPQSMF